MKVGGRVVKFKRSERSVAETRTGKILPKKVGQKSCVKKARKPAPPASPPEPTEWQVEMRRARERRARGAEPDLKQRMLDVLGSYQCKRCDTVIVTGTVVSYIPPFKKADYIAKGRIHAVTRQRGHKGALWGIIAPIRDTGFICVDLHDVYSPLPGKGHFAVK